MAEGSTRNQQKGVLNTIEYVGEAVDNKIRSGGKLVFRMGSSFAESIKGLLHRENRIPSEGESSTTDEEPASDFTKLEGDQIVFRKNNVLYKMEDLRKIPGYLFIRAQKMLVPDVVLILNWVPNSSMCKSDDKPLQAISINLSEVETVKVFFTEDIDSTEEAGHVIVRFANATFYVFHFPTGGLIGFMETLRACTYLKEEENSEVNCRKFVVHHPQLGLQKLHPGEERYRSVLTLDLWRQLMDVDGVVTDPVLVQSIVFFKGISHDVRAEVWPYLLGVYPWSSTRKERVKLKAEMAKEFDDLQGRLLEEVISDSETSRLSEMDKRMEKDVLRADMSTFKGDVDGNRENLRLIILCSLLSKEAATYTQGMTDLALPILAVLQDLPLAFRCYLKLLQKHSLFCTPQSLKKIDELMESLKHLVQFLSRPFFDLITSANESGDMLFCHRWLLVHFKREFSISDIMRVWEVMWACQDSHVFHLLICQAIICMYGGKPVEEEMDTDNMLIYFTGLAHSMPVEVVLSQARGLLHQLSVSELPLEIQSILLLKNPAPAELSHQFELNNEPIVV